jgi:hypothetical protein
MDTNILLNIARFADSQTTFQLVKSGGRALYEDMREMGVIKELDVDDAPAVTMIFYIPARYNQTNIISQIKKIFHVDKLYGEEDEFLHMYKMMWCDYCFLKEMKRSYSSVVRGHCKCLLLMSTKPKMSFLRSLKKFLDSELSYDITFMNPVYHDTKMNNNNNNNIVLKFFRNKYIPVKNIFLDSIDHVGILYEIDIMKLYRIII